ncbi:hypothetical protein JG687_00001311 [Phytophthora cactorum]|uniref:Uncharacterized protein n=2 Tax=Phytophthora TaxID=4783 RepID=A0A8J5IG35_9STRA|nr:hypothetical protein JG688_00009537 [Phytophthora aleatoria]KAG6972711.1 hypothetical protein JG687_00001311 [Phytophthora cactorum]
MLEILKVFGQTYVRNHPFVGSARQNPSRVTEGGTWHQCRHVPPRDGFPFSIQSRRSDDEHSRRATGTMFGVTEQA